MRDILARLKRLDVRMTEAFQGMWKPVAGATLESSSRVWRSGLMSLTDAEIRRGVEAVVEDWRTRHPPVWPEFRELCRPSDGRTDEQRARDALMAPSLPALPSVETVMDSSTMARAWCAFMVVDRHRPMPDGWDMDTVAAHLEDRDVEAMRTEHSRSADACLRRTGVEESWQEWRAA